MAETATQNVSESLAWVRKDLTATFAEARTQLQKFSDNREDIEPLHRVVELFHTAHGALRMVQVFGAALLVEEMKTLTTKLVAEDVKPGEEALEALSRAIVQIPSYLDRIAGGGSDIPLLLLPLLNDLRAARGSPLMSESSLFILNVDQGAATPKRPSMPDVDYALLAKKIRPHYQKALLGWLRGENLSSNLSLLKKVALKLERAAAHSRVYQFWWIIGGVVESIQDQGLRPGAAIKRLLGQADQVLKKLSFKGEAYFDSDPPVSLINSLLYYIARSESEGSQTNAIKSSFSLSEMLATDDLSKNDEQSLQAPSVELMKTVGAAIKQDVANVKDAIDIFVRTGSEQYEDLQSQLEAIKKLADTLGVLGLDELRQQMAREQARLTAFIERASKNEEELIEVASTLIKIEAAVEEQLLGSILPNNANQSVVEANGTVDAAEQTDRKQVTSAVMRECIVNLARVKESLSQFFENPENTVVLDNVPKLVVGIGAALTMLNKSRAATILADIQAYATAVTNGKNAHSRAHDMDRLADAIVSLEYYMETLGAGRSEPEYMLDNAQACLESIKYKPPASVEVAAPQESPHATQVAVAPVIDDGVQHEATGVVDAVSHTTAQANEDGELVTMRSQRIDPELLELFIEEAKEEVVSLRRALPLWKRDVANREVMLSIRRSFHTLKGSGRMVGAEMIGEYSWSFEQLVNELVGVDVPARQSVVELVDRGVEGLPKLIEQLEVGSAPTPDLHKIMEQAWWQSKDLGAPINEELVDETRDTQLEQDRVSSDDHVEVEDSSPEEGASDEVSYEASDVVQPASQGLEKDLSPTAASGVEDSALVPGVVMQMEPSPIPVASQEKSTLLIEAADELQGVSSVSSQSHLEEDSQDNVQGSSHEIASAAATPAIEMDPVLHEIFLKESLEHIGVIGQYLDEAKEQVEPFPVSEALHRAWHTLSGSANTANVASAAGIATLVNQHLRTCLAEDMPLPREAIDIVAAASDTFEQIVRGINQSPTLTDTELLIARIHTLPELSKQAHEAALALEGTGEVVVSNEASPGYDWEIATVFAEEATEVLEGSDASLSVWFEQPKHADQSRQELLRHLHTLKGGARMAGITPMGDLSHEVETLVLRIHEQAIELDDSSQNVIRTSFDRLHDMVEAIEDRREVVSAKDLISEIQNLGATHSTESKVPTEICDAKTESKLDRDVAITTDEKDSDDSNEYFEATTKAVPTPIPEGDDRPLETARVDARLLDEMLNNAGEVSIFHARLEEQVGSIAFNLTEFDQTVLRLREQLRKLEIETEAQILHKHQDEHTRREDFDPLELDRYSVMQQLSRALAESVSDLVSLQGLMTDIARESEALLVQQARVTGELQDALIRSRMLPFSRYVPRFERIVRQASSEQRKQVKLQVTGASGELDRQVLQRMLPPFEHMLRNSIVHGIEAPSQRQKARKPEQGTISIELNREGAEMVIRFSDDGRGLDPHKLRSKAVQLGLLDDDSDVSDREIFELIFRQGFSTAEQVTQSAGRGVGMDVVANEVKMLGGSMQLESQPGQGTTVIIRLPLTLAVSQALLVRCGEERFAIPLPAVDGVERVSAKQAIDWLHNHGQYRRGDISYKVRSLSPFVGGADLSEDSLQTSSIPLILTRSGETACAMVVDELLGSREVVVKSAGPMVSSISGIAGATILGDGSIVIILDIAALMRNRTDQRTDEGLFVVKSSEDLRPLVMVVDDSITVRRVTQRLLERNSMRVVLAKDGVDAVALMQEQVPDLVLLDIEMPRMDGYEVASHIRNTEELQHIPITMITSRVGEKHRARAFELGVDKYLGKPYQENQLLDVIQPLLARAVKQRRG